VIIARRPVWLARSCHRTLGVLVYGTDIGSGRKAIMKVFVAGGSGAMLAADGPSPPAAHALICQPALNGDTVVTIPLAPRTTRVIDLATGERTEGPAFPVGDGRRLDRHGTARRATRRAGISKHVSPHTAPRVHHRRPGRGDAATRRAGTCLPRRPGNHDALRPGADQSGPARHLHRRCLHHRSSKVTHPTSRSAPSAGTA
jgi:hypothetical protein